MTLLNAKLREIIVFIYTLVFLLLFNLFFNLNYTWQGISDIVRIFLLIFFFYLVFIFASLDTNLYIDKYVTRFGNKGKLFLFVETRAIPFFLIFCITVIFTLIYYIKKPNWPWDPILTLLNGRFSNNIIYSWFLLLILRLKKKPVISIPLFLSIMLIFSVLDNIVSNTFYNGLITSGIKLFKLIIFLFFLFNEFYSIPKGFLLSLIYGLLIYFLVFTTFFSLYKFTNISTYKSQEAGLILMKMGYTFPLKKLKTYAAKDPDYSVLLDLLEFDYVELDYSKEEWERLLFSGSVDKANLISGYLVDKNLELDYATLYQFASKISKDKSASLDKAENFIKLFSGCVKGHEPDFISGMQDSNHVFIKWGIKVLGEIKYIESIPLLLNYLTSIDKEISINAYSALNKITDLDPAVVLDKKINDPDNIAIFKQYYIKYSDNHTAL